MSLSIAGVGPRDLLGLVRERDAAAADRRPLVVDGVLSAELARALTGGGEIGAVRVGGGPDGAFAYVRVLGGNPGDEDLAALRAAERAGVPTVALQTGRGPLEGIPYVLPTAVLACPAGSGFPVDELARLVAEVTPGTGIALARRLPALRAGVEHVLLRRAALRAGLVAAVPWIRGAHFPLLVLIQSRLMLDVAASRGRRIDPQERATELGAIIGAGLVFRVAGRGLRRVLPGMLTGALTGYAATRAVGAAAQHRFDGP